MNSKFGVQRGTAVGGVVRREDKGHDWQEAFHRVYSSITEGAPLLSAFTQRASVCECAVYECMCVCVEERPGGSMDETHLRGYVCILIQAHSIHVPPRLHLSSQRYRNKRQN